jgi:hypothetical protein
MHYRILATALVAASVALAACGDDATGPNGGNSATVRFVNATSTSLDIAEGGTVATGNGALSFSTTSNCMSVDATNADLAVRLTGTSTPLGGFTPAFQAGGNYTVIAYAGAGATTPFATVSNAFTPTTGQGGLRVFNAVGAGTSYDVYVGTPGATTVTAGANNIGHGTGSSYFNVIANVVQQVRITNAGTQTLVLDVGTRSFIAGQLVTLVVGPPAAGSTTPRAFYVTGCA